MASPLLAGIPISGRFAEKLGIAQEKQSQQQMTHTQSSTQEDKSWDQTLYEKSDIYRSIKDAYTAPIRAWKGEIDPYSDQGVMEAINLAGVGMGGSIPGGARGVGSFGVVDSPSFLKLFPDFNNTKLRGDTGDLKILYHGTSKDTDFKNFKKSPRGTWLSESPEEASSYAMSNDSMRSPYNPDTRQFEPKNTASRVIPVYVKAEKIYQLTPEELHSYQYAKSYSTAQKQIIAKAEREGYDAVDFGGGVYSVIDPKNIRSAISPGERKDVDLISHKPKLELDYKDFFESGVLEKIGKSDFKSRSQIIEMPIDDFLSLAYPLEKPDADKAANVAKILSTEKLREPLYLKFDHEGSVAQVDGHEGRHRALALKAAGVKTVPVELRSSRIRWSEQDDPKKFDYIEDWPNVIKSESGKKTLPFPVNRKNTSQEGLNEISSPIQDLEASVQEQVKQLDNTGWNRLPGAAGKRGSDVQPTFLQKMYKEHPALVKSKPSELEKLEIKLRRIYKLPEEEIEDIMLPLWSTYLRNQKPDDPAEEHTQKTKMKRWT